MPLSLRSRESDLVMEFIAALLALHDDMFHCKTWRCCHVKDIGVHGLIYGEELPDDGAQLHAGSFLLVIVHKISAML